MSIGPTVAFIFARGGSKGVPGKNLRPLRGRPLIVHAIDCAKACPDIDRVVVSTDDPQIANIARAAGADVPFLRPAELATDTAAEWLAWQHALAELERAGEPVGTFVSLPTTAPLRAPEDITAALALYRERGADIVLSGTPAARSPYFNMVRRETDGFVRLAAEGSGITRRQDAPELFDLTTVAYVGRPAFIAANDGIWAGRVALAEIPPARALDIDTPDDFALAEHLMAQRARSVYEADTGIPTLARLGDLSGRRALITGGAGHLGRIMAAALLEAGADLVLLDLSVEALAPAVQALSVLGPVKGIAADLEDETSYRDAVTSLLAEPEGLAILINNAAFVGTSGLKGWGVPFAEQSPETWRRALEVNLTAPFVLAQMCAPALQASGHGSLINIGSIYGEVGPDWSLYEGTKMGNPAAYGASKGGLAQLTRYLSTTLAPDVRVNMIVPGGVARGQDPAFVARYEAKTPMGRMSTEADFKGAVQYLASDLSGYVTGQTLHVDGGFTAW